MRMMTILLLLLAAAAAAQDIDGRLEFRPLQVNWEYWSMHVPGAVGTTPVHPDDPGAAALGTRRSNPSGALFSLDVSADILPLPEPAKDWFRVGYTARFYCLDTGYQSGVCDIQQYRDERWDAYTYSQLTSIDTVVHNVFAEIDIPTGDGPFFALGWRHMFPADISITDGWDRWGSFQSCDRHDGELSGDIYYVGCTGYPEENWVFSFRAEWGKYDVDFGRQGKGDVTTVGFIFSFGWRF